MFTRCHERENKELADFNIASGAKDVVETKAKSANTGKKVKDKQSQLSDNETKGSRPAKVSAAVSNAGGGPKSSKTAKKKGSGKTDPIAEDNKEEELSKSHEVQVENEEAAYQ